MLFLHYQVWLQYQCLWDMQAENIYNRLGEDLTKWQALLVQIRKARGTFDNAETRKEFGPVVIDYGKVNNDWTNDFYIVQGSTLPLCGLLLNASICTLYS